MNGSVLFAIIPVLLCVTRLVKPIEGGVCLTTMKNGLCKDILSESISKEECCKQFPDMSTAWSKEDMRSGRLFFDRVIAEGVPCYPCKDSCLAVKCGQKEKCVVRWGRPKCVCSPCEKQERNSSQLVCGSDGNTYLNVCRLKRRACRKSDLTVAYTGYCQRDRTNDPHAPDTTNISRVPEVSEGVPEDLLYNSAIRVQVEVRNDRWLLNDGRGVLGNEVSLGSCERIKCPKGKYCLLDQNLSPHCVRCKIRCRKTSENSGPVCGANGVTYRNICVLRQKACVSGKAIPVAYKGKCKAGASCGSVRCQDRQTCLTDASTGFPRCVTCNRTKCRAGISRELGQPICGTNNKTYDSWCHMIKDACATGFVIETKFQGSCEQGDKTSSELVPVTMTSWVNASRTFRESADPQ